MDIGPVPIQYLSLGAETKGKQSKHKMEHKQKSIPSYLGMFVVHIHLEGFPGLI